MLARGLKARKANDDGEEYKGLERAMEYAGVVGIELADMLTLVYKKVQALEPWVPNQHTFRGDGLQNFIRDHQDELECLNHQVENLTTMTNEVVTRLQVREERNCQALRRAEEVNAELLRQVSALEHGRDNPILIPDSPEVLPVRPPFVLGPGSILIPIDNDVDDERNQMITEDQVQVEKERQRLTAEQAGEWGLEGEEYVEGETMEDVLRRVEAWDQEVPRYPLVLGYDDPFVPDVQE